MNVLIVKLGAAGDVVRTTTVLRWLSGQITWLTEAKNTVLLEGVKEGLKCVSWEQRNQTKGTPYDLVINLEDTHDVGSFLELLEYKQLFGAYLDSGRSLRYTDDSRPWFDLGILSRYGKEKADEFKYENRRSYQELIFEGLGWRFEGERYYLPEPTKTGLKGDVAIAPQAGPIWPMKNWAYSQFSLKAVAGTAISVTALTSVATNDRHAAHHGTWLRAKKNALVVVPRRPIQVPTPIMPRTNVIRTA